MDLEAAASALGALSECLAVLVKLLLVSGSYVAEPFAVRVDATCRGIRGALLHLLDVWLSSVHVQPVNGCLGPEL